MELNTEQIIQAMECCHTDEGSCLTCPFQNDYESCVGLNKLARSELERLNEENERLRADTVREMQERLKAEAFIVAPKTNLGAVVLATDIDRVTEKMLEENNERIKPE